MQNNFWTVFVCCFLLACGDGEVSIHPTPLVMNVRVDVPNAAASYIEKYFTRPIIGSLKAAPHVSNTHAIAIRNGATITVFFEEGIKFAEGEDIIQEALSSIKTPKKIGATQLTELCGDDLSQSNLMHIAKAKGIKAENILDNVITVSSDLAANIMPKEEYNAMFSNECDDASSPAPLYVLEN